MNEDVFNSSLRSFWLRVGVTSRSARSEKPSAMRSRPASSKGNEKLPAKMVLTIGGVALSHEINDEIELG